MRTFSRITVVAGLLVLTACNAPPQNRGTSGNRMDPTSDSPSELGSQTLRSADLVAATDRMAQDIAQRLDIANRQSPPRIFVGKIENKTSGRNVNYQVFLVRLRAQLQESGARHGLEFIREREFIESQRAREYGEGEHRPPHTNAPRQREGTRDAMLVVIEETTLAAAYQSRADYVLTCEIYDLPSGGTNYYLLDYQLVQLRDASSGPDVGPGAIVWEKSYEVKFQ